MSIPAYFRPSASTKSAFGEICHFPIGRILLGRRRLLPQIPDQTWCEIPLKRAGKTYLSVGVPVCNCSRPMRVPCASGYRTPLGATWFGTGCCSVQEGRRYQYWSSYVYIPNAAGNVGRGEDESMTALCSDDAVQDLTRCRRSLCGARHRQVSRDSQELGLRGRGSLLGTLL